MRTHRVFSQNSPSLAQNSVSSLSRNSSLETVPSSWDPLHPFIFVFELITVTFTSPLHLINLWELFFGRCNRGRGARYWAVCVLLADSSCVMFRIWTSFGSFVLVWRSADLKLQVLPPWWWHHGGRPGLRDVKKLAPGGWGKLRTQVEWGTFHLTNKKQGEMLCTS